MIFGSTELAIFYGHRFVNGQLCWCSEDCNGLPIYDVVCNPTALEAEGWQRAPVTVGIASGIALVFIRERAQ